MDKKIDTIYVHSDELHQLNLHIHELESKLNSSSDALFGVFSYDTVFTVIVTLGIFIIGIIVDRVIKQKEEQGNLNRLKENFQDQLKEFTDKSLPSLIRAYKDAYQKLFIINNGLTTTPPKLLVKTYNRISNLESPILYQAVGNAAIFNTVFSQVDSVRTITQEADLYHESTLQKSNTLRSSISELEVAYIEELIEYFNDIKTHLLDYKADSVYLFLKRILDFYFSEISSKRRLVEFYKHIVIPLQDYFIEEQLDKQHTTAENIVKLGKKIIINYRNLRLLNVETRLQYRNFTQLLIKARLDLNSIQTSN